MPATLTAETVIDREIEKCDVKATKLRAELEQVEQTKERLKLAAKALTNGHAAK